MAMTLSASPAAAAATQGAGSACGSVAGSVPVANATRGNAAASSNATAAINNSAVGKDSIILLGESPFLIGAAPTTQWQRGENRRATRVANGVWVPAFAG